MASYSVVWKNSAVRELRSIHKQYIQKIVQAVETLAVDPLPHTSRKLHGVESSYRLRIADYRVIYQVDAAEKSVTVFHVKHRKDVYR